VLACACTGILDVAEAGVNGKLDDDDATAFLCKIHLLLDFVSCFAQHEHKQFGFEIEIATVRKLHIVAHVNIFFASDFLCGRQRTAIDPSF
jgi:hypothetical protein